MSFFEEGEALCVLCLGGVYCVVGSVVCCIGWLFSIDTLQLHLLASPAFGHCPSHLFFLAEAI